MTENFYYDDPDEGIERYRTLEAAKRAAESALKMLRDEASGNGWHENIERLEYGILIPVGTVQQTRYEETPDSEEHEFTCDYELVDTGAPNPDRTLRYIRNAVQSYRAGGDMAAAVFAIGLIERILEDGQVPELDDVRLSMCDDISLIAQEWAAQSFSGQSITGATFMRRICDVLGSTYGGDNAR